MTNSNTPFGCMICSKGFAKLELLGKHVEKCNSNAKQSKVQSPTKNNERRKSVGKKKSNPNPDERTIEEKSSEKNRAASKI